MAVIYPVVLCGGSGTRLWPRSRKQAPKPFLPLVGEQTLFEATLGRCATSASAIRQATARAAASSWSTVATCSRKPMARASR